MLQVDVIWDGAIMLNTLLNASFKTNPQTLMKMRYNVNELKNVQ